MPIWKRRYTDRGITVCDEWSEPWPFLVWADENGFDQTLTLDRIDNDNGYSPDNCRWVDMTAQARNRSTNSAVAIDGIGTFSTIAEAADAMNTSQDRIYKALKNNWLCFGHKTSYAG
jgi:hypothetical protein